MGCLHLGIHFCTRDLHGFGLCPVDPDGTLFLQRSAVFLDEQRFFPAAAFPVNPFRIVGISKFPNPEQLCIVISGAVRVVVDTVLHL